ncbi:MAG: ABC-type transport auxiliary lipoprotein family protein [Alphaproteobacteria bacterium]|nr:ABC-type transport auxiliary lipoprotein family protein [Alphaproteobacteria bacterium]
MKRRLMLLALLPGCSVLPERPYVEARRFPLEPRRASTNPARPGAPLLLLRAMRAGSALETRGLRRLRPDGTLFIEPYAEWAAPPPEAAEAALRDWLRRSGLFSAVTAPGTRLATGLVLENELLALQAGETTALAAFSALLIDESGGQPRLLGQAVLRGEAAVTGPGVELAARAMAAALANALQALEAQLPALLAGRR